MNYRTILVIFVAICALWILSDRIGLKAGRYEIAAGHYLLERFHENKLGVDEDVKTIPAIIKIDTVTGKTWIFTDFMRTTSDKTLFIARRGWVEVKETDLFKIDTSTK